jgi:acetylornithine deacetylase/succinyl-diaminopimelate desuccinylase-like protein
MYLFARRAPVAGIGVGHARSNIHAPNESIRLDDFRTGIVHVARLLEEMAR